MLHYVVRVNKGRQKLYIIEHGNIVETMKCSTGIGHPFFSSHLGRMVDGVTPEGSYKVTEILETDNLRGPYGPFVIGLDAGAKAIHGTNEPEKLGKPATGGCVRVSNRDIRRLVREGILRKGLLVKVH